MSNKNSAATAATPSKESKVVEIKQTPLQIALAKLADLQKVVDQRAQIVQALDELNAFTPSADGGDKLTIVGSDGARFSTGHPEAIAAMIEAAQIRLNSKLATVESQISF